MPENATPRCHRCHRCGTTDPHSLRTTCARCEGCADCCECAICAYCGNRCDATCDHCGSCPDCCRCQGYQHRDRNDLHFSGTPTLRHPRFVGVEIECMTPRSGDHRALTEACETFDVVATDDCSLRPATHGDNRVELTTHPTRGEALVNVVEALCAGLKRAGAYVNKSAGLHVHVDARDLTPAQVLTVARLYARVEPRLYKLVARSRASTVRGEGFAAPWGERLAEGLVSDETASIQDRRDSLDVNTYGSLDRAASCRRSKYKDASRYHGLNFNALDLYGTLEFRLHHGTTSPVKVLMWASVVSAIVQYASTHSEAEAMALRGTPSELLEKMLPDREVIQWTRARYVFFLEQERARQDRSRARRGLPPLRPAREPRTVRAAPVDASAGQTYDPGEHEEGEAPDARGGIGRRGH